MFKKALSLLLALMLIVTSISVTLITVAAAGDDGEPQEETTFIVAGSPADIFGTAWDAENADNAMTAQDDGSFTKTYTVTKAYTDVQVKAVKNGADWYGDETGNNVTFDLTEAGDFTVTATPVDDNYVVSVTGDIVQFNSTLDYTSIFAVGNGEGTWLNDASWDPGFLSNEMTETAPGIWEIEFENVGEGFDRQVKFAIDGAWTHNFGGTFVDFDTETEAVYNGDNITFDTEEESQTIKLTLDMNDFDFSTKEGAKFTVSVIPDEDNDETTVPDQDTTAAPTTTSGSEAESTEAASDASSDGEDLTVTAESNLFPTTVSTFTQDDLDACDNLVTVTYFIQSDMRLVNADWLLTYDGNVLEFNLEDNMTGSGRDARVNIMPNAPDAVINDNPVSVDYGIKGNCTNLTPYYLNDEDGDRTAFVTVTFKAKATGDTTVRLDVSEMRVTELPQGQTQSLPENETQLVENGTVLDNGVEYAAGTEVYTGPYDDDYEAPTEPPTTEEPTTEAPTTEEPTTVVEPTTEEPTTEPAPESNFVVAGAPADIFGTAWDAANADNTMTAQTDGTFTKTYTVDKAFTDVQLKAVDTDTNTWYGDETGNNVTFNLTGAGTFTVTATPTDDGYVVSVAGDIVEFVTTFEYDTVFAVGNGEGAWLNDGSWDPGFLANEMTEVADDLWEIEFECVGEGFDRQIKFAIDGAWTHNFGGVFEDSGVETDAVYNGDNITFDTEYDFQTVKAQLDMREFDFASKTGAKFTITITEKDDAEVTTSPETTTEPPVEETTVESTTVESTTTEPAPQGAFTVNATSNFFPETSNTYYDFTELEDANGDVYVVVEYKLLGENKRVINIDVDELTWDPSVLEYKEEYNMADGALDFFPFAAENGFGEGVVNTFSNANGGRITGNYTSVSPAPYAYNEDGTPVTAVKAVFKVLDRTAGETTVNCVVDTVSLCDEELEEAYAQYIPVDGKVISDADYEKASSETVINPDGQEEPAEETTVEDTTVEDTTVEDTTVENTTEEPGTTAEPTTVPVSEDTFVVAGSPADIFGTAWDAANTDNTMTAQPDGTFTKTYTVDKAFTSVQLKGVKNGADWYGDETGNNLTFNLTGAGTFTVTATPNDDGYVMSATGDIVEFVTDFVYNTVFAVGNGEGTWLNDGSWDPAFAANEMTQTSENVWEIEFNNVGEGFDRQIKFAIDGAWTHNFGGAFEDSGVTSDAVYNGDNITFDTEYESQTVKAVLDLSEFDFSTKEGAKFTITITEEGAVEDTTAAETTVEPTTEEPAGGLDITAESNYSPTYNLRTVDVGETVTVNFSAPEDLTVLNMQWGVDFDNDKLELTSVETFTDNMLVNDHATSHDIIGNFTDLAGASFTEGQNIVSATFTVKAPGETDVTFTVIDMTELTDDGEVPYYVDGVNVRETPVEPTTVEPTTEEPAEDTTVEETTTELTTEAAPETTFVVAGSPADIFGTAWDAANTDNTMTANPDGTFTKTYTVGKAFTDVQLKGVKNGADWYGDETGNNVTFNLTGEGTFTVTATPTDDGYVMSVAGDIVQVVTDFDYETVFAVGNGEGTWLNDASWDPAFGANEMTEVADDVWEIEFSPIDDGFDRQIKFAIDGSWTHNFGGTFDDFGVETDAVYNGDNITFDTEYESQTVKAVLDLTEFDFSTKEGAKFTITITEGGDIEDTTAEQTTENPEDKLSVSGTSNYCPAIDPQDVAVGESVTMNFVAPEDADIIDIQWGLTYDKDLLELTASEFFTGSMLANNNATTYNSMGNMTDINGVPVSEGDTIASFTFNVKAASKAGEPTGKAGADVGAGSETVVDFNVIDMTIKTDDGDQIIIADSVDQRTPEEPTTEAPEETTETTTEAPEETTETTTEAPEETTLEPTTQRPEDSLGVSGVSNYCDGVDAQIVKNGESVTVTFKAPENVDIIDLQWSLDYDNDLLELTDVQTFTSDMLVNKAATTHDALGSVANVNNPYSVTEGDDFVSFTFTAKGTGDTEVVFNVIDMSVKTDDDEETYFVDGQDVREQPEPTTEQPEETTEEPEETTAEPEETTEEPTTEESTTVEPTTEAPADKLVVTGSSNYCDGVNGQIVDPESNVTVTFKAPEDVDIINLQWALDYDNDLLEFVSVDTFTGDMSFNYSAESHDVMGSVSNLTPYSVSEGDTFVTATFTAKAPGTTDVALTVIDMSVMTDDGEKVYFADGVDVRDNPEEPTTEPETTEEPTTEEPTTEEPTTEEPTTEEPTTEEPTTEEPTTEEPTTEEPTPDTKFIVAGNTADIFGTAWDATNEDNLMTANGDGTFTKTYTVDKAYNDVQLKAVDTNTNSWYGDENGDNVTFNITGPGDFTVTATPDGNGGYVVTVSGDNIEQITEITFDDVFVVGNGEGTWLNGASWDPAYSANMMNKVADGVYEIEFTNVPEGFDRQVKFALDGAWTHNFGGAFDESGVATDADYNGDNITFDTEDESQTVKIQLDLRDFDYTTKEGAKFTVTITPDTEPTTAEPTTAEPTTAEPTTVEPTTVEPTTVEPTTVEPTTVPLTSEGEEEEEESYMIVFSDGSTAPLEKDENGNFIANVPVDGEEEEVEFKIVKVNPDGSQEDVTNMQKVQVNGDGTLNVSFDPDTNDVEAVFTPAEEGTTVPATTKSGEDESTGSTDATSATSSVSTPDNPIDNNSGAVQTGNASMAIIILLVLVSATAGIYFARKKQN